MEFLNAGQKIEMIPVSKLRIHPENARKGSVDAITESVEDNGFIGAIVVQKSTGHILIGNHRYKAIKAAGEKQAPVLYVDVDDSKALDIVLADNAASDKATYDNKALVAVLEKQAARSQGLKGTGYTQDNLNSLLDSLGKKADDGKRQVTFSASTGGGNTNGGTPAEAASGGASAGGGAADAGGGGATPRGLGNAVVNYNIVFDNDGQQQNWFRFIRGLKTAYPEKETIGARLDAFITARAFPALLPEAGK